MLWTLGIAPADMLLKAFLPRIGHVPLCGMAVSALTSGGLTYRKGWFIARRRSLVAPTNTLTGTTGNDILNAPGSVDTLVQGLPGNDTITLVRQGDVADAAEGNDIINATGTGALANTIAGGLGNDTININGNATIFSGSVGAASGTDLITINAATLNGAFIGAGVGNDTVNLSGVANIIGGTIQLGDNADLINLSATMVGAYVGGGKGSDSISVFSAANTTSSVTGGEGHDSIQMTGASITYVAGGAGNDTINLGGTAIGTVVGGGLSDTITFGTAIAAGTIVYGDGLGVTSAGTGSGGTADGADLIGAATTEILSAASIYGAGGNDTLRFLSISAGSYLNGGANADRITFVDGVATAATIAGANGADTITIGSSLGAASVIQAGAGQDSVVIGGAVAAASIYAGAGLDTITIATGASNAYIDLGSEADTFGNTAAEISGGTLNGGDGADTIQLGVNSTAQILGGAGNDSIKLFSGAFDNLSALSTINGGAGTDTIWISTAAGIAIGTAAVVSAYNLNAVYESGDKILLSDTANVFTAGNWNGGGGQVLVLSANNTANLGGAAMTALNVTGGGNVAVFADENETTFYISDGVTGFYAYRVQGADLVTTTAVGTVNFTSTSFNFTLAASATTGLTITLG